MQTYIVYIFTFLIIMLCAYQAQRTDKKAYVYLIIISLSFVAGFRSFTVGMDTKTYVQIFKSISVGDFDLAWGEVGFKHFSRILLKVYNNPTFVFSVFALITNGLIILRLWDFKRISSFVYSIACYYIAFYFMSMNIMRQFVAIAIIFYATRFIAERKYIWFFVAIAAATSFHTSSLIAVVFVGLEVFQWKYLKNFQKILIGIIILISPFAIKYILNEVQGYSHYFTSVKSNNIGFMLIVKLIIYAFSIIVFNRNTNQVDEKYDIRCIKIYYLLGIILNATGYFFSYMERIGLPFYLFECAYFGVIVRNTRCNQLFKLTLILLLAYLFIMDLISNGQGQIPYKFIWQSA